MKILPTLPLLAALLLAACSKPAEPTTAPAAETPAATAGDAATAPTPEPAQSAMDNMPAMAKTASASGTVESVDAAAGKITLAHGPVEALGWPAMTMGFKATPEQIASVKVGQKVDFEFTSEGMDGTITKITPQP